VLEALGEPYITTRPGHAERGADRDKGGEPHGMGLGFFIAKTLLERSGATVTLDNRSAPETGAIARIVWPRAVFESHQNGQGGTAPMEPRRFVRVQTGQGAPS
jgi:two-component system sensor histidine kinase RegB